MVSPHDELDRQPYHPANHQSDIALTPVSITFGIYYASSVRIRNLLLCKESSGRSMHGVELRLFKSLSVRGSILIPNLGTKDNGWSATCMYVDIPVLCTRALYTAVEYIRASSSLAC